MRHYYDDPDVIDRVLEWDSRQAVGAIFRPLDAARRVRRETVSRPPKYNRGMGAPTVAAILCRHGWEREWDGLHKVEHVVHI